MRSPSQGLASVDPLIQPQLQLLAVHYARFESRVVFDIPRGKETTCTLYKKFKATSLIPVFPFISSNKKILKFATYFKPHKNPFVTASALYSWCSAHLIRLECIFCGSEKSRKSFTCIVVVIPTQVCEKECPCDIHTYLVCSSS
jgi:hypothetical protein